MAYEKIVSIFDTEEHARAAEDALRAEGFPSSSISVLNQQNMRYDDTSTGATAGDSAMPGREPGFWKRLFGGDVREHEAEVFGRSVEAGSHVLTIRVEDTDADRAMRVLEAHNPVDIQERAADYGLDTSVAGRPLGAGAATGATGVTGTLSNAGNAVAGAVSGAAGAAANALRGGANTLKGDTGRAAMGATGRTGEDEEVIRLAEEQLTVGKRQVEAGTTRIRRFVTEKPVEEQVTLHQEHAEVLRRAVTDPSYIGDVDWSDKTIEVREMSEEAVVGKTTRLAEEVVVRKEGTERTETVKDTVRRQQVEVEHVDAAAKSATNKP